MVILAILLFISVLLIDVITDYRRLINNTIDHKRGMLFRSIGMIPSFCLLYFPVDSISVAHIFLKFITVSFMLAFWWWEFFDGLLNYARNKPWRFNGSDDPDDAKTDDILQGMTPGEQGMLKWGLIIFSTLVYICFFN